MTQFFFDPGEYATEQNWADSTDRWSNTPGLYTSTTAATRDSPFKDRAFRVLQNDGITERYMRSFDVLDTEADRADVELLVAFKSEVSTDGNETRLNVRGSGVYATADGYSFGAVSQADELDIIKLSGGTRTVIASTAMTIAEETWYRMRVRANGTALKMRVWPEGDDEPTAWSLEVTDGTVTAAGWIGIQHAAKTPGTIGYSRFAFVSVATGGDTAVTPLSRADFRAWLGRDAVERTVLAEMQYMQDATLSTMYWSTRPYQSTSLDSPALRRYDDQIQSVPNFDSSAGAALTGRTSVAYGELVLHNADGELDGLLQANVDGREVHLLIGDASWPRYDFRPILRGVTSEIVNRGRGAIVAKLRDKNQLGNTAIQDAVISGGPSDGLLVPLTIGKAAWLQPRLLDEVDLEYQAHEGVVSAIGDAYDSGIIQRTTPTISSVDTGTDTITTSGDHGAVAGWEAIFGGTPPSPLVAGTSYYVIAAGLTSLNFRVSATVGGSAVNLTTAGTAPTVTLRGRRAYPSTGKIELAYTPTGEVRLDTVTQDVLPAAEVIDWIAKNRLDLTGFIDDESIADHAAAWPDTAGIYIDERQNALDVIDALVGDSLSLYSFSRDGLFFLAWLDPTPTGATVTIRQDDIFDGLTLLRTMLPVQSILMRHWRNSSPSTQFAEAVAVDERQILAQSHRYATNATVTNATDDPANHANALERLDVETYLQVGSTPAALTALGDYRGRKVAIWSLTTTLIGLELRLGDPVTIVYPRFGFDAGLTGQVIGTRDDIDRQRVMLTVAVPAYSSPTLELPEVPVESRDFSLAKTLAPMTLVATFTAANLTSAAYAGAASNVASGYTLDDEWTGTADAVGAPTATFATTFFQTDGSSKWLYVSDFGLSLPSGATILGIKVKVWYRITLTVGYGSNGADIDLRVAATKDGSSWLDETSLLFLTPASTPYETAASGTFLTVESSSGLWGTTWSEADVEASAFGFGIRVNVDLDDALNNFAATVDAVEVTVTYST